MTIFVSNIVCINVFAKYELHTCASGKSKPIYFLAIVKKNICFTVHTIKRQTHTHTQQYDIFYCNFRYIGKS